LDLTGCWLLDPRRSDSLEEILKYHDVPWHLRKVARRVVPTVYLKQTPTHLQLMNVTSLRTIKEEWVVDNQFHEANTGRGTIKYMCRLSDDGQSLITTTSCKQANDTEETIRSLAEGGKVLVLHIRIWSHYYELEKKKEILKITRIFDRVENKDDPWASTPPTSSAQTRPVPFPSSTSISSPTTPLNSIPFSTSAKSTESIVSSQPPRKSEEPVTPLELFLTKVLYPNHLSQSPSHLELYNKARDLMVKIDRLFIVFVVALILVHYLKH